MADNTAGKLLSSASPLVTVLGAVLFLMGLVSSTTLAMGAGLVLALIGAGGWYVSVHS